MKFSQHTDAKSERFLQIAVALRESFALDQGPLPAELTHLMALLEDAKSAHRRD